MLGLKFSTDRKKLLCEQVIDRDRPGPVLRDFEMLLDFVGADGVKAAGKHNLLPIDAIPSLDERLARPLRLNLARPQLRSHPYLQGLHLLLRASTLGRIDGAGDKARMRVDPERLASYQALNATEQYFTLLEAWLRFARPEMVGERGSRREDEFLFSCVGLWQGLGQATLRCNPAQSNVTYLPGIGRQFLLLALMDQFGIVKVEHFSEPVRPWIPAEIKPRPFGDALFALLANWALFGGGEEDHDEPEDDAPFGKSRSLSPGDDLVDGRNDDDGQSRSSKDQDENELDDDNGDNNAAGFGAWQPLFQPYFPEWRNNLELPQARALTGTCVFKVTLGKIWRRIALDARATLETLAQAILRSVQFDRDHLYEFTFRDEFGATVRAGHPYCESDLCTDEVPIGTLPLQTGQSMQFLFDFGDCWNFDVKLESIDLSKKGPSKPKILEKRGKSPEQYRGWD
jgi:hypothetical protein